MLGEINLKHRITRVHVYLRTLMTIMKVKYVVLRGGTIQLSGRRHRFQLKAEEWAGVSRVKNEGRGLQTQGGVR